MNQEIWVIVDTETSGLGLPIYCVEIAAQKMIGWEPAGEPFRILLNHDVEIEPMAESLHGYSREYLRKLGENPLKAHKEFNDFAKDYPIVTYNISFDWNRVLEPEYNRLGVPVTGKRGFCALTLARRVIDETENYQLETLKNKFNLSSGKSHKAFNDVESVVNLFRTVYRERLEKAGIFGFENISNFSKKTPVIKCLEQIKGITTEPEKKKVEGKKKSKTEINLYLKELQGICSGIIADGEVNAKELFYLQKWLTLCPVTNEPVLRNLSDKIEKIYEDGIVTNEELMDISEFLKKNIIQE